MIQSNLIPGNHEQLMSRLLELHSNHTDWRFSDGRSDLAFESRASLMMMRKITFVLETVAERSHRRRSMFHVYCTGQHANRNSLNMTSVLTVLQWVVVVVISTAIQPHYGTRSHASSEHSDLVIGLPAAELSQKTLPLLRQLRPNPFSWLSRSKQATVEATICTRCQTKYSINRLSGTL
jgi:hypothetical protein